MGFFYLIFNMYYSSSTRPSKGVRSLPISFGYFLSGAGVQDTGVDKALRVVDGAIYVAKAAPLGTAVKVRTRSAREGKWSPS